MEIENYKNLSDWLLSGSRQMTKREFCYILTLENVGLPGCQVFSRVKGIFTRADY